MWRVEIFRNGSQEDGFYLVLFFPSEGFQDGRIEVGAAIDYTDYYATEVVSVKQGAVLPLSFTPYFQSTALDLTLKVDVVFVPL